jgi:hypothetical protein
MDGGRVRVMLRQDIPTNLDRRSRQYGAAVVEAYRSGRFERSRLLMVPGRDPIWSNPEYQYLGRCGEVAFCLAFGIDPNSLSWCPIPDDGADVTFKRCRIDVKSTHHPRGRYLIWPLPKNRFLHLVSSDAFVFVRRLDQLKYEIVGWVMRDYFDINHDIASSRHPLDAGTWYMDAARLWEPTTLPGAAA